MARAGAVGPKTKQRACPIVVETNCRKNGEDSVLSIPGRIPSDRLRADPGFRADQGICAQLEFPLENHGLFILESIIVDHWVIDRLLIVSGFQAHFNARVSRTIVQSGTAGSFTFSTVE
jgi:hypothetical protein